MEQVYRKKGILFKLLPCLLITMYALMCLYGSNVYAATISTGRYGTDIITPSVYDEAKYHFIVIDKTIYDTTAYLYYSDFPIEVVLHYNENYGYSSLYLNRTVHNLAYHTKSTKKNGWDFSNAVFNSFGSMSTQYPTEMEGYDLSKFTITDYFLDCNVEIMEDKNNTVVYSPEPSEPGTPERGTGEGGNTGNPTDPDEGNPDDNPDSDSSGGILSGIKEVLELFKEFIKTFLNLFNPLSKDFILYKVILFLGDILDYLNPFSDNFILKGILDFFSELLSYINPFSDNFILKKIVDFFIELLSYINPFSENFFVYKLIELLKEALNFLFVPSQERLEAIPNIVKAKFEFIESIKIAVNSVKNILNNLGNAPKISLNLGATKYTPALNMVVFDLSWYAPYKSYGDLILTGFIYLMFIWRLLVRLPSIIHGQSGSVLDSFTDKGFDEIVKPFDNLKD